MRKDIVDTKSWDREIIESCPMLYCMASRPMDETCMCWGFECGEGWRIPLESLSKKLEAMNLLVYPKHRVKIQACQVKEKYGFLHFYFDVSADPSPFICFKRRMWQKMYDKLRRIDYSFKFEPELTDDVALYDKRHELTAEEYEVLSKQDHDVRDVEYISCSNSAKTTYYEVKHVKAGRKHRVVNVPTKHKLLYKLAEYSRKKMFSYCHEMTPEQAAIAEFMHDYANSQVSIATKECESRCEQCGAPIGDKWNPTCTTTGWIKQLCEKCAIEGKHHYYKGEKLYCDGKAVVKKKHSPKASVKKTNKKSK